MSEDVVVEETKRQTVILIFSLVGTVLTVWAFDNATSPHKWQETKMKFAQFLRKYSIKRADFWLSMSDKADRLYNNSRG